MRRLPLILFGILAAAAARAESAPQPTFRCTAPTEIVKLSQPLVRVANRLARGEPVTIVAIGSSSTAGTGATTIAANYPSRLMAELSARVPGAVFRVINRGVGGEDVREMLLRFDRDVRDEKPDLVLWQLGTNALLDDDGIMREAPVIREGVQRVRAIGADLILVDPQYAPKVLKDPDAESMVELIDEIGHMDSVAVFQRFALMRHWNKNQQIPFERFLSEDLFHMNDWSYACWAEILARAIVAAMPPAAIGPMIAKTVPEQPSVAPLAAAMPLPQPAAGR